jgi:hypothetical protein
MQIYIHIHLHFCDFRQTAYVKKNCIYDKKTVCMEESLIYQKSEKKNVVEKTFRGETFGLKRLHVCLFEDASSSHKFE